MIRVLRPNGRGLIYVWAKNQAVKSKSTYLLQNKRNNRENDVVDMNGGDNIQTQQDISAENSKRDSGSTLPIHTNRTQFEHTDILVPWKLTNPSKGSDKDQHPTTFLRYYHVFEENELESLCKRFTNISIEKTYYDQGNWCVIFQKNAAT